VVDAVLRVSHHDVRSARDGTLMDNGYPPEAWKRLGSRLTDRRVELGYPFRKRKAFWEDRGDPSLLSLKTVERIERAERPDYTDETLAVVERLYGYEPGSVKAILRGGDGIPADAAAAPPVPAAELVSMPGVDSATAAAAAELYPGDRAAQALLLGGDLPGLADWLRYRQDRREHGYPEDRREGRDGTAG
jgi:hypothetical protein